MSRQGRAFILRSELHHFSMRVLISELGEFTISYASVIGGNQVYRVSGIDSVLWKCDTT